MSTKEIKSKLLDGETVIIGWEEFKKFLTDEVEYMDEDFNMEIRGDHLAKIKMV